MGLTLRTLGHLRGRALDRSGEVLTFRALKDTPSRRPTMAIITRFDPFRDLARIQEEMGRLLDERGSQPAESIGWTPACDVYEDAEEVVIRAALAGVDPKDVEIRVENGVLTLKGERKVEKEEQKENYHRVEMAYGFFTRTFALPTSVDPEKVHAESKHGVLAVHLPKRSEAKPRSIQVKVQ
jgi:HSP20 family protein